MNRILLTGGSGQLGQALLARDWGDAEIVAPPRGELDLGQHEDVARYVREGAFDAVVSAGAYTAVDAAESDPLNAWAVNAMAPLALATACAETGAPIVHISTDYVFDGSGTEPLSPAAPLNPIGVYGASKAAGEIAVRSSGARHAILRTAWVVSATGKNFVKTMLRLAGERDTLGVVADQHGSPTAADDLAHAVAVVSDAFLADPERASGTWHAANAGHASWHELAQHVFASSSRRTPERVDALTTAQYPTPAKRPANSRLSIAELERDFAITMRNWKDAVAEIVAHLERD